MSVVGAIVTKLLKLAPQWNFFKVIEKCSLELFLGKRSVSKEAGLEQQ